jgi:hypothetical protein
VEAVKDGLVTKGERWYARFAARVNLAEENLPTLTMSEVHLLLDKCDGELEETHKPSLIFGHSSRAAGSKVDKSPSHSIV